MGSGNTELKIFIFCLYFEWNANNEEAFILLSRNAVFMGKGSRNLHASFGCRNKINGFQRHCDKIPSRFLQWYPWIQRKKSRNYIHRLEVQRKRTVMNNWVISSKTQGRMKRWWDISLCHVKIILVCRYLKSQLEVQGCEVVVAWPWTSRGWKTLDWIWG